MGGPGAQVLLRDRLKDNQNEEFDACSDHILIPREQESQALACRHACTSAMACSVS